MCMKRLKGVAIATSLVMGTLFITAFITVCLLLFLSDNNQVWFYLGTRIALLVSVIIVAHLYNLIFNINYRWTVKGTKKQLFFRFLSVTITLMTTVILLRDRSINAIGILLLAFLVSAIAEEVLFRGLVEYQLKQSFCLIYVMLIQAVLFAFLGHQAFNWYSNLIIRLPLGIALSVLRHWTDSYSVAITAHYVYNASVFFIF